MISEASIYRSFAEGMTYREREILKLMYGHDNPQDDLKCEDVARIFNLSPNTVREIIRKIAKGLRSRLEAERA